MTDASSSRPRGRRVRWERRTPLAGAVVLGIVGSLLLGWYWAGAADTEARARLMRQRPVEEMRGRVGEVAAELRRDLEELLRRESQRPYYHYSNLFRDPRSASTGLSLSPSPLASGPSEPLVADHFQINARGEVSLPTINDEEPELSERARLAEHVAVRGQLAAIAPALRERVLRQGVAVAAADGDAEQLALADEPPRSNAAPEPQAQRSQAPEGKVASGKTKRAPTTKKPIKTQVERLDPEIYAQNAAPEQLYKNILGQQRKQAAPPVPAPSQNALRALDGGRVSIETSPLAWQTIELASGPELVALREVSTPDGRLVQGLTVDRDALERWLSEHEVDAEVGLLLAERASSAPRAEVLGPWSLVATPPAAALAAAAASADALERGFLLRFVGVAVVAALAGLFVISLMASAERLARERSQFAAAAAHELRTPLAGLQLYGDMLADGLGDPAKSRDYARRLSEEAARLGRVVANVLGFSQLERGNLSVQPAVGDVVPVLRELVARAEPALDRLGAYVEVDMPAQLLARFDRDALVRIVGNLLDNAEKYARAAEDRTITLSAAALSSAGSAEGAGGAGLSVEICVRDRGPGIDAATSRRLFRPFSRGGGPDRPAGLGLGLALSRSLAEAMGGSLRYRRREGREGREGPQTEFALGLSGGEPAPAGEANPE